MSKGPLPARRASCDGGGRSTATPTKAENTVAITFIAKITRSSFLAAEGREDKSNGETPARPPRQVNSY